MTRGWLCGFCALCLLLAGCASIPRGDDGFAVLDDAEAHTTLAAIAAGTNGWRLVKYTLDCRFEVPETATHEAASEHVTATCVWEPGNRLRLRARRYRVSVADVLFDGSHWYFTDELNQRAYRTRHIARVRVQNIPRIFFRQLQQMPHGWINPQDPHRVAVAADAYRVETQTDAFTRRMIFPRDAALPSEVAITTPDGGAFHAALSAPDLSVTAHAAMFVPFTSGYEFYDLDTGERISN